MNLPATSLRRFGPRAAVVAVAGATAISAILYAGTAVTAVPQAADVQIIRPANGFADLVETVRPAVVNISTRTIQPASFQDRYRNHGGSGHPQFDGPPKMRHFMERFFGESFPRGTKRSDG